MRRSRRAATLALLAALVTVSTGVADATGGAPLPRPFRKEANAICRDALREILDAQLTLSPQEATDPTAASAVYLDQVQPIYRQLVDDLRALEPPNGRAAELRRLYAAMDRAMDRAVTKIEGNPTFAVIGPGTFDAVNDRLRRAGLRRCA